MKIGITFSSFDLFRANYVKILENAKQECSYLICGIRTDPTIDRQVENRFLQSVIERYIKLKDCKYVDEIVSYTTERNLDDILRSFKIYVRIIVDQCKQASNLLKDYSTNKKTFIYI